MIKILYIKSLKSLERMGFLLTNMYLKQENELKKRLI